MSNNSPKSKVLDMSLNMVDIGSDDTLYTLHEGTRCGTLGFLRYSVLDSLNLCCGQGSTTHMTIFNISPLLKAPETLPYSLPIYYNILHNHPIRCSEKPDAIIASHWLSIVLA